MIDRCNEQWYNNFKIFSVQNKKRQIQGDISFTDTLIERATFSKLLTRCIPEVNGENFNDFVEAKVGVLLHDRYPSCDRSNNNTLLTSMVKWKNKAWLHSICTG